MFCKCTSCGELLTKPYFYNGGAYGFTCIKKVNPSFKKSTKKTFFVKADTFETKVIDENTIEIIAKHFCSNKNFIDYQRTGFYVNGSPFIKSDSIQLVNNEAFIDLMKYKNSYEFIKTVKELELCKDNQ